MTGVQNYYSDYCSLLYELLLYEFVYVCRVYVLDNRCMCAFVVFFCKLTDRFHALTLNNSLSTKLSSHNALYVHTNRSQITSSQFTLNKNTNNI